MDRFCKAMYITAAIATCSTFWLGGYAHGRAHRGESVSAREIACTRRAERLQQSKVALEGMLTSTYRVLDTEKSLKKLWKESYERVEGLRQLYVTRALAYLAVVEQSCSPRTVQITQRSFPEDFQVEWLIKVLSVDRTFKNEKGLHKTSMFFGNNPPLVPGVFIHFHT